MAAHTRRGFTLIELIVVIVILGVLASLAVSSFRSSQERARTETLRTSAKALERSIGALATGSQTTLRDRTNAQAALSELPAQLTATLTGNFAATGKIDLAAQSTRACLTLPALKAHTSYLAVGNTCPTSDPVDYTPGTELVGNGAFAGNNANFSPLTYDSTTGSAAAGSGRTAAYGATQSDARIPVDPTRTYRLSLAVRGDGTGQHHYAGIAPYDVDGNLLHAQTHSYLAGTTTTLAADLRPGDTTISLTSASGWLNVASPTHQQAIMFWSYADSTGYVHPPQSYTLYYRCCGLWGAGAVDTATNTITLAAPWNYNNPRRADGVWPAGTAVSNNSSGGTFKYVAAFGGPTPATWQTYTGSIGGVDYSGGNVNTMFPPGTVTARILLLHNYHGAATGNTYFDDISLRLQP